jgi:hypothetical protein
MHFDLLNRTLGQEHDLIADTEENIEKYDRNIAETLKILSNNSF